MTSSAGFPVSFWLGFVLLVPLGIAGLALVNAGLGRSRSAAHAMTSALCASSVAMLAFFVCGFAIQGSPHNAFSAPPPMSTPGMFLRDGSLTSAAGLPVLFALFSTG